MVERMRVVFLGDSVTAGYGLGETACEGSYFALLRSTVGERPGAPELIASALDGVDTTYALKRFARMVTALDPDWVVVVLGLNDAMPRSGRPLTTAADYGANLRGLVDRILSLGSQAVLVTPSPRFAPAQDDGTLRDLMPEYVKELIAVARQSDVQCIDLHRRFVATGRVAELIPDGTHPNLGGHRLIAELLAAELACLWTSAQTAADAASREREPAASPLHATS